MPAPQSQVALAISLLALSLATLPNPALAQTPPQAPSTIAPSVQPTPATPTANNAQPAPVAEPNANAQPAPVAEPNANVQPAPVAEPNANAQPAPVAEPNAKVQPLPTAPPSSPPPASNTTEAIRNLDIREVDVNVDRLVLMPTAETQPKGRLYFSAYEVIFWQLGYAFTDRIQATVTSWPYIVEDQVFFADGTVKANLLRTDLFRLAAIGGAAYFREPDADSGTLFHGGAAGQLCVSHRCWTSIVGSVIGWKDLSDSKKAFFTTGIGITAKLNKTIGLLLELDSTLRHDGQTDLDRFGLMNYGLRFSGKKVGVDIAMIRPFPAHKFVLGLPWIAFTYRTDALSL
jgi:hypothetical protein